MKTILLFTTVLAFVFAGAPHAQTSPRPAGQGLGPKRSGLSPDIAITTLSAAELRTLPKGKPVEHDSEVSRSEAVTVVVSIAGCQPDSQGACNASADVTAYKPDGTVHAEMKNVTLAGNRGTVALKLGASDVTGVYKVVATVRDINAKRFGTTERMFGVK